MNVEDLLSEDERAIVSEVCRVVAQLEHYRRDGTHATRCRIEALYKQLMTAVAARDLNGLRAYVAQIARERLEAGFELPEVEAAFSALEEAIWCHALVRLPPYDQAFALGLASTALAHGRDALERGFHYAHQAPEPYLDLTPLFTGAGRVPAACAAR
jgi:hypothetical protein